MPTTYTPNASNDPATFTLPSDLDNATAESLNQALRALADKGAHAYQVFAQLALSNVFAASQVVDVDDSVAPLLKTTKLPGAHPGHAENKWKRVVEVPTVGDSTLCIYSGTIAVPGHWCITHNARWGVGDQQWIQQDAARDSVALMSIGRALLWSTQPPGTSAQWSTWPTLRATGSPLANILSVGEFAYAQARPRTTYLQICNATGAALVNGADGSVGTAGTGNYIRWPLHLPPGAELVSIAIKAFITDPGDVFALIRRDQGSWDSSPTAANEIVETNALSNPATVTFSSVSSGGPTVLTIIATGIHVGESDDFLVRWTSRSPNAVSAIRVDWLDPGPRNR